VKYLSTILKNLKDKLKQWNRNLTIKYLHRF
jgi:hypothetical protein